MLESRARIFHGIERQRRLVLGETVTVRIFGVLFLQITGVGQKDGAEIGRRMGAENGSAKAALDQQRQIAGVVEMGVRENDGVDAARFDRKLRPILEPQRLEPLKQAAVDEQLMLLVLDKVFSSR